MESKVYGMLGLATKAGKIAFGTEQVLKFAIKKQITLIIIAEDTSENSKKKMINNCQKYNIDYVIFGTKQELSRAIGKENKAIIALRDKSFSDNILKIINN